MTRARNITAHLIAALGLLIVVTEVVRHWIWRQPIDGTVVAIGAAIGFVGAYASDHKAALEGGGFLVDSAVKVGSVFRIGGRRSTDTVVVQEEVVAAPPAAPAPKDGGIL